jgi:hypothetical protein
MKQVALALGIMIAITSVIYAQPSQAAHKELTIWLGNWTGTSEVRDSPSDPWQKLSASSEVRSILGGVFNESRGKLSNKGKDIEWLEISGYDPAKKTAVGTFFYNDGGTGHKTSITLTGNKLEEKGTYTAANGKISEFKNSWTFAADFTSLSGTIEMLFDGKWAIIQKISWTKTKGSGK